MKKIRVTFFVMLVFVCLVMTGCTSSEINNNTSNTNNTNNNETEDNQSDTNKDKSTETLNTYINYYLVYYKDLNQHSEEIYFGFDEESFERKFSTEYAHIDLEGCKTMSYSDDEYGCFFRKFYKEGYLLNDRNNLHFETTYILDANSGELLEFENYNKYRYIADENIYIELDFKKYDDLFDQYNINNYTLLKYDRLKGESYFLLDDNRCYHLNTTTEEIIPFPEGYYYRNTDLKLTKFLGFTRDQFIIIDTNEPDNYKIFNNVSSIRDMRYLNDDYVVYIVDNDGLYLYNLKDKNKILLNDDAGNIWDVGLINNLITYIRDNTLYIYDLNTKQVVEEFNNVSRVFIGKYSKQIILVSGHKLIWYSLNGTISETNVPEDINLDWITPPIITEDILFFPEGYQSKNFIVYKDTGFYGEISENYENKVPVISYILGDNRVYVSFENGDSYIITKENIEYLEWMHDTIH